MKLVVLPGQSKAGVPDFLTPAIHTVYTVDKFSLSGMEAAAVPAEPARGTEPPLWQPPVFGQRDHTLSLPASQHLAHEFALRLSVVGDGQSADRDAAGGDGAR